MKNYEMLIFDCDGTLVDSEYLNNLAVVQLLAEEGLTQYDMDHAFEHFVGLRIKPILDDIAEKTGHAFSHDFAARYVQRVEALAPQYLKKIPGAEELVAKAKEMKKICVASNGQRNNVVSSLEFVGIKKYLPDDHIFTAVQVKNGKPAPDLYLLAAQEMGVDVGRCMVIEDSIAGVTASVAAGMRTYGFVSTHQDPESYGERLLLAGATSVFTSLVHIRQALFS
jgi:HAD superfamily hydrolase (TIGR01509 family)